ncbi:PucR family transcriptional regulator [Dethiothermospora halolimnae]|uniref:PucR family transcriptional regulator n=1 Tax=Dethiothermospora halolimnae TaxID=3114390 RepID=UPI003CCC166A
MAVYYTDIYNNVKSFNPRDLWNDKNISFNNVQLILKDQWQFHKDTLYIGKSSDINNNIEEISMLLIDDTNYDDLSNNNLLLFPFNTNLPSLFNTVNDLFSTNLDILNSSNILLNAVLKNKSLDYLVKTSSDLLNNPVVLIDTSFKVISHSDINDITDPLWVNNINSGYCSYEFIAEVNKMDSVKKSPTNENPFLVTCRANDIKKLTSKIFIDNKMVGYVIMLECNEIIAYKHQKLLNIVSKVLADELKKDKFYKNMRGLMYEKLLVDLIEDKIKDKDIAVERIKGCGYNFNKDLALLALDLSDYKNKGHRNDYLKDSIDSIFPMGKSIFYNGYILYLIYINDKFIETKLNKLEQFIKEEKLYVGISDTFENLLNLNLHYSQSINALKFGKRFDNSNVFYYGNYKLHHLLSNVNDKDLTKYCQPEVIKLRKYDNIHNTNYYETLYHYLINNKNTNLTADKLFIHRNTINYRINKIQEIIDIDFKDGEATFNILASYKILNYHYKKD